MTVLLFEGEGGHDEDLGVLQITCVDLGGGVGGVLPHAEYAGHPDQEGYARWDGVRGTLGMVPLRCPGDCGAGECEGVGC